MSSQTAHAARTNKIKWSKEKKAVDDSITRVWVSYEIIWSVVLMHGMNEYPKYVAEACIHLHTCILPSIHFHPHLPPTYSQNPPYIILFFISPTSFLISIDLCVFFILINFFFLYFIFLYIYWNSDPIRSGGHFPSLIFISRPSSLDWMVIINKRVSTVLAS